MSELTKFSPWRNSALPLQKVAMTFAVAACAFGLFGCEKKAAEQGAPPPAQVTVAHPVQKEVMEWDTYTGFMEAPQSVNLVARISGMIMESPFKEGTIVKKGDLLYVIDERPFKADLDAKLADQQKAEAALSIAKLNFNRVNVLLNRASTQQEVDDSKATVDQNEAAVASAKAAVESSRLNLEWCRVLAPIDGRVSSKLITVGNFVNGGAGQATLLTTIQSVSPIYCYVDVDENSVLKYQKLVVQGKLVNPREGHVPCYLQLGNEAGYPHVGYIDFVDNHLDATTGTQRVRGILDNTSGELTPGYFARLRIPGSGKYTTMLVPDSAVGNDQDQRYVLIVDKDNKVIPHPVEIGTLFGSLRSVVSGLTLEDQVVVNGQMHARPGSVVSPIQESITVDPASFIDPAAAAMKAATSPAANSPAETAAKAASTESTTQPTTGN